MSNADLLDVWLQGIAESRKLRRATRGGVHNLITVVEKGVKGRLLCGGGGGGGNDGEHIVLGVAAVHWVYFIALNSFGRFWPLAQKTTANSITRQRHMTTSSSGLT